MARTSKAEQAKRQQEMAIFNANLDNTTEILAKPKRTKRIQPKKHEYYITNDGNGWVMSNTSQYDDNCAIEWAARFLSKEKTINPTLTHATLWMVGDGKNAGTYKIQGFYRS